MKALIIALAFGVVLPVSAFAQDAPPFLKAIEPQAAVNSAWRNGWRSLIRKERWTGKPRN